MYTHGQRTRTETTTHCAHVSNHELFQPARTDKKLGVDSLGLFVSASGRFWPPKAAADCQTLSFSASFYKIRWSKNHPKST
jgi:hypothetical protein